MVQEIITDKDSSMNAIYSKHFPEGTITYCANHCAKTLHKDLQKIKQNKCQVMYITKKIEVLTYTMLLQCRADGLEKCKRMSDPFLGSCKAALNNLISGDIIKESKDPYTAFSQGILNFHHHYCLDEHSSSWCIHEKV